MFLAACLLYIWIQSLFVHTTHEIIGQRHIFRYGWTGIILGFGFNLVPIGTAWFLWRVEKDRIGAAIFLLFIPVFAAFVMPQLFLERVEVTPAELRHRREPPHTRFNADIAFTNIASAVELDYDSGLRGFEMLLKDGRTLELPANTVLTAAHETISAQLLNHQIPVRRQTVHRKTQ
ncbi:MAG: hypothetical protein C5B50_12790 [Verrucomicrobia bacterium]|nr:MAG: hypothetical protein C5B50_12790 [Verrucomicrobiota bacterium]